MINTLFFKLISTFHKKNLLIILKGKKSKRTQNKLMISHYCQFQIQTSVLFNCTNILLFIHNFT